MYGFFVDILFEVKYLCFELIWHIYLYLILSRFM